ncbi:ATP-binding protein [Propioniciclava soli]|uniref:ATP-binding protein n=1 Tax=Propioniciclava soli TaxID=2775081 RepID=UPI001E3851F6|nr:ATP-binding protein [Propioniciclava soli]
MTDFDTETWVPDTIDKWRQWVAYAPVKPTILTTKEAERLSEDDREDYRDARLAWLNSSHVLATPDVLRLRREFDITTAMNSGQSFTARQALAVSGTQTMGKSTAVLHLGKNYERKMMRKSPHAKDPSYVPVIYLALPETSTPKALMRAFARTLGADYRDRTSTDVLTDRIAELLREKTRTSLVILDEVQRLTTKQIAGSEAAGALKGFMEKVPASFVLVGVDLPRSDLLGGPFADEIAGRVTMHEMRHHGIGTAEQREDWDTLLHAIEENILPLADHELGSLEARAGWLHDLTGGNIGSLMLLLRRATTTALIDGDEQLTDEHLDQTVPDYRAALTHRNKAKERAQAEARARYRQPAKSAG